MLLVAEPSTTKIALAHHLCSFLFVYFLFFFFNLFFRESLCSPGYSRIHYVDQVASNSFCLSPYRVLVLKAILTMHNSSKSKMGYYSLDGGSQQVFV